MSEENKPKNSGPSNNKKRRRRNYKKKSPRGPNQGQEKSAGESNPNRPVTTQGANRQQNDGQGNKNQERPNRNNNRRRNSNRNKKKKPISTREVVSAYIDTISRYLKARKDYHDSFRGSINKKVKRTFDGYFNSLRTLRKFESTLKPWQREELEKNIEFFPKDDEFSSNHPEAEIAGPEEKLETEEKTFFHELISQKERPSYSDDTEESVGNKEIYLKYKEDQALNQ